VVAQNGAGQCCALVSQPRGDLFANYPGNRTDDEAVGHYSEDSCRRPATTFIKYDSLEIDVIGDGT
jgi:hypothetical protein